MPKSQHNGSGISKKEDEGGFEQFGHTGEIKSTYILLKRVCTFYDPINIVQKMSELAHKKKKRNMLIVALFVMQQN